MIKSGVGYELCDFFVSFSNCTGVTFSLEPQIHESVHRVGVMMGQVKGGMPTNRNTIQQESDMILGPLMDVMDGRSVLPSGSSSAPKLLICSQGSSSAPKAPHLLPKLLICSQSSSSAPKAPRLLPKLLVCSQSSSSAPKAPRLPPKLLVCPQSSSSAPKAPRLAPTVSRLLLCSCLLFLNYAECSKCALSLSMISIIQTAVPITGSPANLDSREAPEKEFHSSNHDKKSGTLIGPWKKVASVLYFVSCPNSVRTGWLAMVAVWVEICWNNYPWIFFLSNLW